MFEKKVLKPSSIGIMSLVTSPPSNLIQFIETCIFSYLHSRKVYASHTFDRRRVFDLIVYSSRLSDLVRYVSESLRNVEKFLASGELRQICAVLADNEGNVTERLDFTFIKTLAGARNLSSLNISKDFARAALVRLTRLQLPEFTCTDFSLAFEVGHGELGENEANDDEFLIVRDRPDLVEKNVSNSRTSTIPIVTVVSGSIRLCVKVETIHYI